MIRTVDADNIDRILSSIASHYLDIKKPEIAVGINIAKTIIHDRDDMVPTVWPASGHWIPHMRVDGPVCVISYYECSECHGEFASQTNHCPDCGALMDKE